MATRNGTCTRPLQSRVEVGVALQRRGAARRAVIFSGAHPGGGLRRVSEANAMRSYAREAVARRAASSSGGDGADGSGDAAARLEAGWLLEERSTSTRTNALFSLAMVLAEDERNAQRQEHGGQSQQQRPPGRIVLATNPFHQLRSYLVFRRAMAELGMLRGPRSGGGGEGSGGGGDHRNHRQYELFVAAAPFAGHHGYGCAALDAAADAWDFARELAALAWYALRGWL